MGKRLDPRWMIAIVVGGAFVLLWPTFVGGSYELHMATMGLVGIVLALGLNVFFGFAGQINFGAAAFYAFGAYAAALAEANLGLPFLPSALVIAPLLGGIAALFMSVPLLRLRGHSLALGTFAFAYVVYIVIEVWTDFTGGGNGLRTAVPGLFGQSLRAGAGAYYLTLVMAAVCTLGCLWFTSSRHGRALKAIRANELVASTMGVNVMGYKRVAFIFNGVLGGLAGGLLTIEVGMIGPTYFDIWQNVVILMMVVVGGMGSNVGAIIGGAFMMLLPDMVSSLREYAILIYGTILLVVLRFLPGGLWSLLNSGWRRAAVLTRSRPGKTVAVDTAREQ